MKRGRFNQPSIWHYFLFLLFSTHPQMLPCKSLSSTQYHRRLLNYNKDAMLIPLLFCAMCSGQSVKAVSLGQTNSFESGGVLSESQLIPPLASLLRSRVSELPPVSDVPPSKIANTLNVTIAVALKGYIVERHAGFFSCNLWVSAKSQQLNSCSKGSNGEYIRLTATSTDQAIRSFYTDSECATTPKSQGTIRLQACSIFGHTNVYSATSAPPSPRPFVKIT